MKDTRQSEVSANTDFTDSMDLNSDKKPLKKKSWRKRLTLLLKKNTPHMMKNASHRPNTDDVLLWGQSLEQLLSHKYGRAAFLVFLKAEFCEENLEFWSKCEDFRTLTSQRELRARANSIYEEFVQSEAPKEINLDFQTRNAIVQSLPQPTAALFVSAQRKVYSLMENNAYQRFILSDFYKNLCSTATGGAQEQAKTKTKDQTKTSSELESRV